MKMKRSTGIRGDGFTLVEILVVLGIISLLAALLMPVLGSAREKSRAAMCLSNLHQLYEAGAMYASDYDQLLPPFQNGIGVGFGFGSGQRVPSTPIPERGEQLVEALKPYTKSSEIWFCPTDRFAHTNSEVGNIKHKYASYRCNLLMGKIPITGVPTTIDGPKELEVLAGRSSTNIVYMYDNLWPDTPVPSNPSYHTEEPAYSHNSNFNFIFFDGHARSFPWIAPPDPPF